MTVPMIVCGAAGRMGRALVSLIAANPNAHLHAAIEAAGHAAIGADAGTLAGAGALGVAVTHEYAAVAKRNTVTLDFTTPASTLEHLRTAVDQHAAIVIGTTGFDAQQRAELDRLATSTRSVVAPNMSVGVNVLLRLVAAAAQALGDDFDPEIVEIHHRMKVDAPSGTALELGRAVADALGRDLDSEARYGRHGVVGRRSENEIGILSMRGGDAIGDHTVVFAGAGERLELTHRAQSRDCLAGGAIRAGIWLVAQPPGRYSMANVLGL